MNLSYLKILVSPFKPFKLSLYVGKVSIGTPYFLPRRWVKNTKTGYLKSVPKRIGFDIVDLGWKTKWSDADYRFEWSPLISFVFFKFQIALIIKANHRDAYWTAWLYYHNNTDKSLSKTDRIKKCIMEFPLDYVQYKDGVKTNINYYEFILRKKYLKYTNVAEAREDTLDKLGL